MGLKSRDPHTSRAPSKCTCLISASQIYLDGREIGKEQHFFEVKSRGKPHISHPNWSRGSNFGYVIQLRIFYRLAEKKGQFLRPWPLRTQSPKLGHNWISTPKSWKSQKAHLELLLNIHNKFEHPSFIQREVLRGTNSRNDRNAKTRPKNHFFKAERGLKWG